MLKKSLYYIFMQWIFVVFIKISFNIKCGISKKGRWVGNVIIIIIINVHYMKNTFRNFILIYAINSLIIFSSNTSYRACRYFNESLEIFKRVTSLYILFANSQSNQHTSFILFTCIKPQLLIEYVRMKQINKIIKS